MNKIKIIPEKTILLNYQFKNKINKKIETYSYYHQSLTFICLLIELLLNSINNKAYIIKIKGGDIMNKINKKIETYVYYHQSLAFICLLIGLPLLTLLTITILVTAIMLPITLIMGYSL